MHFTNDPRGVQTLLRRKFKFNVFSFFFVFTSTHCVVKCSRIKASEKEEKSKNTTDEKQRKPETVVGVHMLRSMKKKNVPALSIVASRWHSAYGLEGREGWRERAGEREGLRGKEIF